MDVTTEAAAQELPARLASISGLSARPHYNSHGSLLFGRLTLPDVVWSTNGFNVVASFLVSIRQLAEVANSNLLWTDQVVQRGIRPELDPQPARELSLLHGFPDTKKYIFHPDNAQDMAGKIVRGEPMFLDPLVWNLRPGQFEAVWDESADRLHLFDGRIYIPDSHHRHQAILSALRAWNDREESEEEEASDIPLPDREFRVDLYFLSSEDEGNFFYDKNQRPRPTAKSKAYDLSTQDDLGVLAKRVIHFSPSLKDNTNRVTDRLTSKNRQVVTLSTLRAMMQRYAGDQTIESGELDGLARVAAVFYEELASVRPELGHLDLPRRTESRRTSIAESAVAMHGYAHLMKLFRGDVLEMGLGRAKARWRKRLKRLAATEPFNSDSWTGDVFSRENPAWESIGVLRRSDANATLSFSNTSQTRQACGDFLEKLVLGGQSGS